jgi:hypothetical protein
VRNPPQAGVCTLTREIANEIDAAAGMFKKSCDKVGGQLIQASWRGRAGSASPPGLPCELPALECRSRRVAMLNFAAMQAALAPTHPESPDVLHPASHQNEKRAMLGFGINIESQVQDSKKKVMHVLFLSKCMQWFKFALRFRP